MKARLKTANLLPSLSSEDTSHTTRGLIEASISSTTITLIWDY